MKKIFLLLMVVVMMNVVYAQPPIDNFDGGLHIEVLDYEYHPIDTPFYAHAHVYETDTGVVTNNTDSECFYHLYGERVNWNHLDTGELDRVGIGFSKNVNESFFNETGDYAFLIWCDEPVEPNSKQGGYEKFYFTVYDEEKDFNNFYGIVTLIALLVFIVMSVWLKMIILGALVGVITIIAGVWIIFNSLLLGFLLIVGGIFITMFFGMLKSSE